MAEHQWSIFYFKDIDLDNNPNLAEYIGQFIPNADN